MAAFIVFYDANVLYPAELRNFLMHLALIGVFRAKWSAEVHEEWISSLLEHRPDLTREKLERTRQLMDKAAPDALVTGYEHLISGLVLPDEKDRHVLAAAIRCGASVIVTCNLVDFPRESLHEFGIEAQHSTSKSYRSNIKLHLKPRWGEYLLDRIRPMAVEDWLKKLPMAPKSKTHIRSVMHLMFECATRWELFSERRNPIALVRVKDGSKRRQRPAILTVDQFETIIALLKEPYRTMGYIAQCLGLRVSEIAALQWDDFDFGKNQLLVQRSIVNGNVDDVKTEYSQDYVPLHPSLTEVVLEWSKEAVPTEEGWVFANPITEKPYFPTEIQRRHIRPAGWCLVDCPKCGAGVGVWCSQDKPTPNGARLPIHKERRIAAGKYSSIGWHTFRHTYRSWLDETGAPMKVQQELMRHASIQTTMNVYGQAMSSSKREANGKVVEMVLKPVKASA